MFTKICGGDNYKIKNLLHSQIILVDIIHTHIYTHTHTHMYIEDFPSNSFRILIFE